MERTRQYNQRAAFTLVEVLIVVLILSILAALVMPQFSDAADQSRENALKMDLFRIRSQLEVYKQQHNGNYPADFAAEMLVTTDEQGNSPGPFGPYFQQMPVNPVSGGSTIGNGAIDTSDWYYDPATGEFFANNSGFENF